VNTRAPAASTAMRRDNLIRVLKLVILKHLVVSQAQNSPQSGC
jgi:hypothetical protein